MDFSSLINFFKDFSSLVWGWPMIIMLLGTHLFLTIRLRFPQLYLFKALKLSLSNDGNAHGDVSQFGALATSLAATIGTGNIIGVATAVALGGPGAVFWCWITGVLGMSTKYAEALLAVKYRVKNSRGEMIGGPMYALERGLGMKWLGILFCVFTALAAFGIGNTVQANSISLLLNESYHISPHISGLCMSVLTALVVIFGVKGIAKVCTALVPFMAVLYVVLGLIIIITNITEVPAAIVSIIKSAFTGSALAGGAMGSMVVAMQQGIARGIFSNESGLGSAPIAAAAAVTKEPARQGLVSMTGTFIDTIVICTMTGISVVIAGSWMNPDLEGVEITMDAFQKGLPFPSEVATFSLMICLVFFAFTTILGWNYYGERCVEYLFNRNKTVVKSYRWLYIAAVFIGPYMTVAVVWNIADVFNALMAFPNLIALLALNGVVVRESKDYFARLKTMK